MVLSRLRRVVVLLGCMCVIVAGSVACGGSPAHSINSSTATSMLDGATVRVLLVGDPFAMALNGLELELEQRAGGDLEFEIVGYDDLRRITLRNALDRSSYYDIVSFDSVWVGEYGEQRILLPLNAFIDVSEIVEPDDFLRIAYRQSRYADDQLGLPIQPHPELLWIRRDRFDAAGLLPPRTTDELLQVARQLNDPARNQYGICWNGQRGQPLGQQMAHFYAAFGQPLLDADGRPSLATEQGLAAARFARDLVAVSPPDILNMAWDQRTERFAQGGCLMTYGWAARSYLVEETATSRIAGKVDYLAAPHAPDTAAVTPLGTWSLGIPANIGARRDLAWRTLEWLTSPEIELLLAQHGNGGMPRYSIIRNSNLAGRYPAFSTVAALDADDQLADWMRPALPQWPALAEILGTVYHDMLRGKLSPEQATQEAQRQALELFAAAPDPIETVVPSP
jgi:multiple sugar transport system substrate-binding protein